MLSRKNIIRYGSLIYWGIILFISGVELFSELSGEVTLTALRILSTKELVTFFLTVLFVFMLEVFATMISWFELTIIYFGGIVVVKKFYKEKADITDKKNDNYYRNLLKDYPVGVLGYIKDFMVDESEVVGTILSLELKNKISINGEITIENTEKDDLSFNEAYILDCLIKKVKPNIAIYTQRIKEDSKKLELLVEKDDYKKARNKRIIIAIIGWILLSVVVWAAVPIYNMFIKDGSEIVFLVFVMVLFCSVLIGFLIPFIVGMKIIVTGVVSKLDPYVRSKKAMELNEKMNGLENFLKDFSVIHERNSEELVIWKDYLIYSVIFGQNDEIKQEILEKLKGGTL